MVFGCRGLSGRAGSSVNIMCKGICMYVYFCACMSGSCCSPYHIHWLKECSLIVCVVIGVYLHVFIVIPYPVYVLVCEYLCSSSCLVAE